MSGDFDPPDVNPRERDDEWRKKRDRQPRDRKDGRGVDPWDVFLRDLALPRDPERELVHDRDREYTLNGSESRTLSTVGAFRVVSEHGSCPSTISAIRATTRSTFDTSKTKDSSNVCP